MSKLLPTFFLASLIGLFLFVSPVLAHEGGEEEGLEVAKVATLEEVVHSNSIKVVMVAAVLVFIFVVLTVLLKERLPTLKKFLFAGILVSTIAATIFLATSTIYLNMTSNSGGPVHWHADFELWDCGKKLELADPQGLSNRVGSATFHEHNDNRIHVEGVVVEQQEASLGRFFGFIGGKLTGDEFEVPTNSGSIIRHNGDLCEDGEPGFLQAFVYKTAGKVFTQEKLTDPTAYVLSPYGNVPPGDCIIVEFGEEKERTDKLCDSYKLQKLKENIQEGDHDDLEGDQHGN